MVVTRRSTGSFVVVIVTPGEVSVWPYTITISLMFIFVLTCFITSIGQGEPAMIPVRRDLRLYFESSGGSSSAMNMVGTPWTAVQRSFSTVLGPSAASKGAGQDHGRTVGNTGHVAEDHAEAVVERDGDAEPVLFGKAHAFADDSSRC